MGDLMFTHLYYFLWSSPRPFKLKNWGMSWEGMWSVVFVWNVCFNLGDDLSAWLAESDFLVPGSLGTLTRLKFRGAAPPKSKYLILPVKQIMSYSRSANLNIRWTRFVESHRSRSSHHSTDFLFTELSKTENSTARWSRLRWPKIQWKAILRYT